MREITLKDLLEAGCHFGHHVNRWHPKAASFIYGNREGVHIIDLAKTHAGLLAAARFLQDLARNGGTVVFVGVKRQAKSVLSENLQKIGELLPAGKSGFYYLLERWPGGLLTNFLVIKRNNLDAIVKLRDDIAHSRFVTKKEKLLASRKLEKYQKVYGGLVGLEKLPDAIFLVDLKKEAGAAREARKAGVKIVAIADTNTDPSKADYPIPANDDAAGSVKIIVDYLVDAWLEGRREALKTEAEKAEEAREEKQESKQMATTMTAGESNSG